MSFEYSKLRGRIRERFATEGLFAREIGVSKQTLSAKLNNKVLFSQREIKKMCSILDIATEDIPAYFFTEKVQET